MRQDGLIRHIGLSNVSADQLRTAQSITDIAAVTVQYNVAVRDGPPCDRSLKTMASCSRPGTPALCPGARTDSRSTQ